MRSISSISIHPTRVPWTIQFEVVFGGSNREWLAMQQNFQLVNKLDNVARNTTSHRFHSSNFRYSLTLFSKFFSSFPHGTCLLSVSHLYLALDGIYHPLWAAIPSNSTQWRLAVHSDRRLEWDFHPILYPIPGDLTLRQELAWSQQTTFPKIISLSFSRFTRRYWGNPG